jgi:hypothetical protein
VLDGTLELKMNIITDLPRDVIEFPDLGIVMPDGCRLSAGYLLSFAKPSDRVHG